MTIATTNVVARVAAVVAGVALVLSSIVVAIPASAQTSSYTFTRDLTIGATGADVTALQTWLIAKGYSIPAGATGYFGAQTAAAVAAFQKANMITPAAGYFGPITRAKVNSMGGTDNGGSNGGSNGGTNGGLQGGAGSVEEYDLISSLNNEEIGEDEEDVEVAGLEIEADDNSDLEITAVRLVFDESDDANDDGSDNVHQDFEDYASEVSIWLDGEEVARVDADEFNDDNNWTKTVSLDSGAVIEAGEVAELTVAVTGASNLDSGDLGDVWDVDFTSVRFRDAQGATISEDPAVAITEFSFVSFASAADIELKISEDDDSINDARTVEVDDESSTDDVEVLSFTLEAEGDSDIEIKTFGVGVSVTGASTSEDMISDIRLLIDGDEVSSGDYEYNAGDSYVFEDVDYTIDAGDTVEAMIVVDFLGTDDALDTGDTITFTLGETQTDDADLFDAEDETGENLGDSEVTGSVSGGAFSTLEAGPMVTFVEASEAVTSGNSTNDDVGTFTIKFTVEAFGDTIYVADAADVTTNSGTDMPATTIEDDSIIYYVDAAGSATTIGLSDLVTWTDEDGNPELVSGNVEIQEGESAEFTLTVTKTNATYGAGIYRVLLKGIGWNTDNSTSSYNVYDFNLEDYKTDAISLN